MSNIKILWADDEIDLLKPHVIFLENKGFEVDTVNNGLSAIEYIDDHHYDIIFLDENMPGLSGLETLTKIKESNPSLPVIMITKSEEESIMEDAIGSKISDYLIKPVNPKQILLSIKKNLDTQRLVSEKTTSSYQQEFRNLGMMLDENLDWKDWKEVYKKLVYWELELDKAEDESMQQILTMQKQDANANFMKYVKSNYIDWINDDCEEEMEFSHTIVKNKVLPLVEASSNPYYLIVIDNFRFDQWQIIRPIIREYFNVNEEGLYMSILPTATQYAAMLYLPV